MGNFGCVLVLIAVVVLLGGLVVIAALGLAIGGGLLVAKGRSQPAQGQTPLRPHSTPRVVGGSVMIIVGIVTLLAVMVAVLTVERKSKETVSNTPPSYERAVVRTLRKLMAAEEAYRSANGGFYDTPQCLANSRVCIPGYGGPSFLNTGYAALGRQGGYVLSFQLGPQPPLQVDQRCKVSTSSMSTYAIEAVRVGRASDDTLCADSRGLICRINGNQHVSDGQCPCASNEVTD